MRITILIILLSISVFFACDKKEKTLKEEIIKKPVNTRKDTVDPQSSDTIYQAIKTNNIVLLRKLLKGGVDIHRVNKEGETPLHLAVYKKNIKIIEELYFAGAHTDIKKKNSHAVTPLDHVLKNKYYSVAELFFWPMHYIIKNNLRDKYNSFLAIKKKSIEQKDMRGMRPLHIAYLYKNDFFINSLIKLAVNTRAKDKYGREPIAYRFRNFKPMTHSNQLTESIREKIDDKIYDFAFNYKWLTVGVITDGKISYLRSYGKSNMLEKDEVYASVSKALTSIITIQLHKEGKIISLDDDISKYSKKYKGVMPARYSPSIITFKHLLTHFSGIPHLNKPLWKNKSLNLLFKPGKKHFYTTNGYAVLGEILEEITGMTYSNLVKTYIGRPLKLKSFWAENVFVAPGARIHSTPIDFAKFAEGLLNYKYISEMDLKKILMKNYGGVGLGWGLKNPGSKNVTIMHAGANGRQRAYIILKPEKKSGIVLMGDCKTRRELWFIHLGPILIDIIDK